MIIIFSCFRLSEVLFEKIGVLMIATKSGLHGRGGF